MVHVEPPAPHMPFRPLLVAKVAERTGGRGVDVVLDVVGGDFLSSSFTAHLYAMTGSNSIARAGLLLVQLLLLLLRL